MKDPIKDTIHIHYKMTSTLSTYTIQLTKVTTDIRSHQWNTKHLKAQHFSNAVVKIFKASMIVAYGKNYITMVTVILLLSTCCVSSIGT